MRFLLLALLIALLPLRGWAGGAGALKISPNSVVAIEKIATHAHPARSTALLDINSKTTHPDCHGHADETSSGASTTAQTPVSPSHCPSKTSCGDCQMCHTLAVVATPVLPQVMPLPHGLPRVEGIHFDSALSALSLKPPIA
jgi:hypothetical protein